MAYGLLSLMVKQRIMQLIQLHLFFNTKTCNCFIDWRKMVFMWNYLGIKLQHYLTWPDYLSSCITQKLQALYTVSFCLRYLFLYVCACVSAHCSIFAVLSVNSIMERVIRIRTLFVDELMLSHK